MSYKIILVHVDNSEHLDKRVEVAAKIALRENAHLIGVAVTGISRFLHRPAPSGQDGGTMAPYKADYLETLRQRSNAALEKFETLVRGIGVTSYEKRLIDDEAAAAVSTLGLNVDLIVLGQGGSADDPSLTAKVDFPEYIVLNSECPVLIVPYAGGASSNCEQVLIAWNASLAASRAVKNAMPLLHLAQQVRLVIISPATSPDPQCEESGAEIIAYLARHNIEVDLVHRTVVEDAGHTLLALAAELASDLIVMGCVAHQRWRALLPGGTTRVVLEEATIPVLMSH